MLSCRRPLDNRKGSGQRHAMNAIRSLYHSAPILLAPGSVVLPGNWGRLLRDRGEVHPHWHREMALEEWRARYAPDKPSRLFACFACETLVAAEAYSHIAMVKGGKRNALYEVQKEDVGAAEHRGDFNCVQPVAGFSMPQIAQRYWSSVHPFRIELGAQIDCWEIVTPSPLRIVRRVG